MSLTALGFLGAYGLGLLLALTRHPIFGLFTYMLVFYNLPQARWWGAALPNLRWSLIAALVTLIATILHKPDRRHRSWLSHGSAKFLVGYTAWLWIQYPAAINASYHLEGAILFTKYVLLFYLIYRICCTERLLELFAWSHVIGCFVFGWIATGMRVSGRLENVGGPGVGDSNTLGMHLGTGIAIAGFMLVGLKGWKRLIALGAIPYALNGVILTASRGAALALGCAAPAAAFLKPRLSRVVVYGAMALGGVLLGMLAHELFWKRFETIKTYEQEASAHSRIVLMKVGIRMWKDHPLGVGFRGFEALSPEYVPQALLTRDPKTGRRARASHNTFISVLTGQGVFGIAMWIWLHLWLAWRFIRLRNLDRRGLPIWYGTMRAGIGTAFTVLFVAGIFSNFLKAEVRIWLLAMLACLEVLIDRHLSAPPLERQPKSSSPISNQRPRPPRPLPNLSSITP